jgi:hypothetical protein
MQCKASRIALRKLYNVLYRTLLAFPIHDYECDRSMLNIAVWAECVLSSTEAWTKVHFPAKYSEAKMVGVGETSSLE